MVIDYKSKIIDYMTFRTNKQTHIIDYLVEIIDYSIP